MWGRNEENKQISWVTWEDICKSKKRGGLGVKNLKDFKEALLGKWRWSLFHEEGSLWCEVLKSKYDSWHGLLREGELLPKSLWWKDLKKICGGNGRARWFDEGIDWKVGSREKTRFWLDEWL